MPINRIGNYANPASGSKNDVAPGRTPGVASSTLTMDSFMQLLAKQLQNQDISNPMSNAEMMGQLTSMATTQAMNTLTELSSTQYAMGMMGQTVTVATHEDETLKMKTGVVTGIDLASMSLYIEGDEKPYGLGNIMQVGKVPKKEEDDKDNDKDNGSGGASGPGTTPDSGPGTTPDIDKTESAKRQIKKEPPVEDPKGTSYGPWSFQKVTQEK